MFAEWPLLSLTVWTPILGGIAVLLAGDKGDAGGARRLALAVSIATFILSLGLYTGFDSSTASMQFVERIEWIGAFNIFYHFGVDGISMPLIILTTFTTILVILAGWEVIKKRPSQYMAAFLIMEGLMVGVFSALDSIFFYVFWEGMLVPMFILIGVWGGERRVYATIKFFIYTFIGSVFMLVALIYMYFESCNVGECSFAILDMHKLQLGMEEQVLIFFAFLMAFAVKVPMWPVHTWLPDAHVEAPTGGSVILAAIMLKIGGYGFLRFSMPITPDASRELDWLIILMSLVAVVYIGFVALVQKDMKKLVAYSSIAHMGFVTLGMFVVFQIWDNPANIDGSGAVLAMEGAMIQMISHGFISGALFLMIGVLYDRMHTRNIQDYGGVVHTMPVFAAFAVFFAMSNAGLPGTSGFVGEFMVILAAFKANFWYAFLGATTLILGAAYTLWMVKRVFYGEVVNDGVRALKDINSREFVIMATLAVAVLALGLWPAPVVDVMHVTIENLLQHIAQSKL